MEGHYEPFEWKLHGFKQLYAALVRFQPESKRC